MKDGVPPPDRGRLRLLSEEEIRLWLNVTRTVSARPGRAPPLPPVRERVACVDLAPAAPAPPASPHRQAPPPLAPLERRLRQRLSRGRLSPDAVIDLHGLRRHEAGLALHQFLQRAQIDGAKVVLVVTGKGRAGPDGESEEGVLRRSVPHWLRGHDYHSLVGGFEEASRPHGGSGALYVRLKRRRPRHD